MRLAIKESDVQKSILDLLNAHGIFAFRLNTGSFGGAHKGRKWFVRCHSLGPGAADICAMRPCISGGMYHGVTVYWIECKAPGKVQSEFQKSFQDRVKMEGHSYLVASSAQDVIEELGL